MAQGAEERREARLLTVIGAVNWDISIFEDRFARQGEEVPVRHVEEFSGGKGANVAVACSRILGKERVAFMGALGDDDLAARQLSSLRAEGVVTDGLLMLKGCSSGRAYIIIDSGGRKTIHTDFGANERITPRHVSSAGASRLLSRTGMMIVMDAPTPVAFSVARDARRKRAKVLYSPGVRAQDGRRSIERVVRLSDYVVVDSHEMSNLYPGSDERSALERFREEHPRLAVVMTLGPRGCVVAGEGATRIIEGVDLSILGKRAVNSTGSGDAFLGAFASYLLMGRSTLEAADWANLAGALKATRYETRGSPTRGELESAMSKLKRIRRSRRG
jgi:ribokinase